MFSLKSIARPGAGLIVAVAGAGLMAACSPLFNWREIPVDAQLKALLPCKPDRAERELPMDPEGAQATIGMAGCEAGGATFAVAHWPGVPAQEAPARLQMWQAATRLQWAQASIESAPATMAHAAVVPPAQHWQLSRAGQATPAHAQMRWFTRADGKGGVTVYQATVLGQPSAADAASTFFDGLQPR